MRRWLLLVYLFLIAATVHADVLRGAWHLSQGERHLQLEMTRGSNHIGHWIDATAFGGLSPSAMNATAETPVHFQLASEAGTFNFDGTFLDGDGVGRFTFTPDASYADRLRSLGVTASELTDERLFSLAILDVSSSFIREMQALGYHEALDRYIAFRIHGATPEFVRDLKAAGYDNVSADRLIAFRIHGVTAQFAGDLRDLAVSDRSADRLVAMRIHGVTTDFVRELGSLGYRNLSSDQLIAMRIHRVTVAFIRELAAAGYRDIPVEKLVAMKIRGIDADFVRKVK